MKLIDYRKKVRCITRAVAAAELSMSAVNLWRIETGRSTPMARNIVAIVAWSGGRVTAEELLQPAAKAGKA